jgi:hypothetical protein
MAMFPHQNRLAADNRGDGVFEDQLLLIVVFQQNGIFIERPNPSSQFHTAYQVNRDLGFILADRIQKSVLNVLSCFAFHLLSPELRQLVVQSVLRKRGGQKPSLQIQQPYRSSCPEISAMHCASIVSENRQAGESIYPGNRGSQEIRLAFWMQRLQDAFHRKRGCLKKHSEI